MAEAVLIPVAPVEAILAALAKELASAAAMVEELGLALCMDPAFARHAARLQQFDAIAQTVSEAARLLAEPETIEARLADVRLGAMRERLESSLR